jgi:UDP-galactopyranose mutase
MKNILIVGAGLTGAALARTLAESGCRVRIIDERDHVAGNCHSRVDPGTGIMVHVHGPHIFHTDNQRIWDFVNRFSAFKPYILRTKTTPAAGGSIPCRWT